MYNTIQILYEWFGLFWNTKFDRLLLFRFIIDSASNVVFQYWFMCILLASLIVTLIKLKYCSFLLLILLLLHLLLSPFFQFIFYSYMLPLSRSLHKLLKVLFAFFILFFSFSFKLLLFVHWNLFACSIVILFTLRWYLFWIIYVLSNDNLSNQLFFSINNFIPIKCHFLLLI